VSNYERNVFNAPFGRAPSRAGHVAIDEGLRSYMLHIYSYMALGLAVTGLAALGIFLLSVTGEMAEAAKITHGDATIPARIAGNMYVTPFGYYVFASPIKWAIMLAPLTMVLALSFGAQRMRPAAAQASFWIFAALMGLSLSTVFLEFTHSSIVRVFFIAAASFGALSLWGYTTPRDLSGIGAFLIMGLFGIVLASLVSLFMASSAVQFAVSVVGVVVFAGLTAWNTQRLKTEYLEGAMDGDTAERAAIVGALSLYLNFINLFTLLLQLLGQREE